MARLKEAYNTEFKAALQKDLGIKNVMGIPKITKIVVNMGVGEASQNAKLLDGAVADMTAITGQKPMITKARKSVANFKLREGMGVGCRVTLRGNVMWEFLDRLVNIALPRIRDLTGNSDPLVRLDAIKAVAELGRDAEDLQSLLIRLNPSIESNELAREAAWNGFRDYMSRRSLAERIDASQRLRDTPDLEARYLGDLAETMATTGSDPQAIERVRDRLATVLVGLGRFGEAAGHLRLLFQRQVDRGADAAFATGMRWLDATLHADPAGDVGEVLQAVAPIAKTEDERTRLTDKVAPYLEKLDVAKDPARARKLSKNLKSVNATGWPMRWSEAITAFADRFDGTSGAKAPK